MYSFVPKKNVILLIMKYKVSKCNNVMLTRILKIIASSVYLLHYTRHAITNESKTIQWIKSRNFDVIGNKKEDTSPSLRSVRFPKL